VDGNDILEIRDVVRKAVERARSGLGPSIVENKTYRYRGHFEGDPQRYRLPHEVDGFRKKKDPILAFTRRLKKEKILTQKAEKEIKSDVDRTIEEAVRYAQAAPLPRPEEALEDLFVTP
jgi:TPP-dependent pyruvate/acetoin dehydrogenase alpha subunit